jgi:hypothetical protein
MRPLGQNQAAVTGIATSSQAAYLFEQGILIADECLDHV